MPHAAVYLETFGCQMNELDSELVSGQLRALGYRFVPDPDAARVILYNTCSVREHAEQKVWSRLGELAVRKVREPGLVVAVLGCLAERDGVALIRRMPVVDILCGPAELDKLPTLIDNALRTKASILADASPDARPPTAPTVAARRALRSASQVALQGNASRRSSTLAAAQDNLELLDLSRAISPTDQASSAYVRITRGCNKFCSYCVVPFTRGAEIHRPPDHIVDECKRLADAGVIEITLLGQTVNHYRFEHAAAVSVAGITQPQKGRSYLGGHRADPYRGSGVTTFADLLARIHDAVPSVQRLRFVTSFPRDFGDDALAAIRDHPRICRYLHVPAQSGSDRILAAMNRGYTVSEYLEFLDRARSFLHQPHLGRPLAVAGDIIVGFPTETEDDFLATADLLARARYKNCFIFKYSPRPGTTAYDRQPDDVPDETKRRRNNDLLALQGRISDEISRSFVGSHATVLVEGVSERQAKRASAAAPSHSHSHQHAHDPASACSTSSAGVALTISARGATAPAPSGPPLRAHNPVVPPAAPATVQLSGRTDTDMIVFFDAPATLAASLVSRLVRVRVTHASGLALHAAIDEPFAGPSSSPAASPALAAV